MSAPNAAYERALQRELPWLQGLARSLAHDDGDDLAQETWLRAHQNPPPRRDGLRPWLARVLRKKARMQARSRGARERREQSVPPEESPPSAESMVAAAQLYTLLDELLDELDEEERTLIEARFFEGKSGVEIAEQAGVPAATVRTRLRRSLLRLRSRLDEKCGGRGSWAVVAGGPSMAPKLMVTGAMVMKATLGAALVAGVSALVIWMASDKDQAGTSVVDEPAIEIEASRGAARVAATQESPKPQTNAPVQDPRRAREALRDKVRDALQAPESEAPELKTYTLPAVDMSVALGRAVAPCAEVLDPEAAGRVSLSVHYIGAPDVGALVDAVSVDGDSLGDEDFAACLLASAELVELAPPDLPLDGSFKAHYTVGPKPDPLSGFVLANPDIVERYPVFEKLLEPNGDEDRAAVATEVARAIDGDEELAAAFEQWIVDDGIELSSIREE